MYVYILYMERVIFFPFVATSPPLSVHSSNTTEFADFVSLDIVNIFIYRNLIILSSFE